ncbi:hypothetical protein ACFX15_020787 [Malus domestica]
MLLLAIKQRRPPTPTRFLFWGLSFWPVTLCRLILKYDFCFGPLDLFPDEMERRVRFCLRSEARYGPRGSVVV